MKYCLSLFFLIFSSFCNAGCYFPSQSDYNRGVKSDCRVLVVYGSDQIGAGESLDPKANAYVHGRLQKLFHDVGFTRRVKTPEVLKRVIKTESRNFDLLVLSGHSGNHSGFNSIRGDFYLDFSKNGIFKPNIQLVEGDVTKKFEAVVLNYCYAQNMVTHWLNVGNVVAGAFTKLASFESRGGVYRNTDGTDEYMTSFEFFSEVMSLRRDGKQGAFTVNRTKNGLAIGSHQFTDKSQVHTLNPSGDHFAEYVSKGSDFDRAWNGDPEFLLKGAGDSNAASYRGADDDESTWNFGESEVSSSEEEESDDGDVTSYKEQVPPRSGKGSYISDEEYNKNAEIIKNLMGKKRREKQQVRGRQQGRPSDAALAKVNACKKYFRRGWEDWNVGCSMGGVRKVRSCGIIVEGLACIHGTKINISYGGGKRTYEECCY